MTGEGGGRKGGREARRVSDNSGGDKGDAQQTTGTQSLGHRQRRKLKTGDQ